MKNKISSILICLFCGLTVLLVILVLIGWFFDNETLKRIIPTLTSMNPQSGTCLMFCALSLLILHFQYNNKLWRTFGIILGLYAFIVSGLKVVEMIWGVPYHLDQIFFTDKLFTIYDTTPSRMAPNTAFCLMLLSFMILLTYIKFYKRYYFTHLGIGFILFICFTAILGYIYNLVNLYVVPTYIPMALHTASGIVCVCFAFLVHSHKEGFMALLDRLLIQKFKNLKIKRKLFTGFAVLILIFIIFSAFTLSNVSDIQNRLIPTRGYVRSAKIAELEMRRYEKDFLSRDIYGEYDYAFFKNYSSENINEWNKNYNELIRNVDELINFFQKIKNNDQVKSLSELKTDITKYADIFKSAYAKYYIRGFNDFGLEGKMKATINSVEEKITDPQSEIYLLQMRRFEKNFFLRNDITEIAKLDQNYTLLQQRLNNNIDLSKSIEQYHNLFNQIVAIDKEIGLNIEDGLIGQMRSYIVAAEPILNAIEKDIILKTNNEIELINKLLLSVAIIIVFFSIILSSYVSRIIIGPLLRLKINALEVAKGNFSKKMDLEVKDEVGELAQAFNVMTDNLDYTNKKRTELINQLATEKNKAEKILQSIGDGVFVTDKEGKIMLINKVAQELTGFTFKESIGVHYSKIFKLSYENPEQPYPPFIERVINENIVVEMDKNTLLEKRTGEKISIGDSAAPIIDKLGNITGCIVVFRDNSSERNLEKAKDEFLSIASHQLRTPLGSMRWNLEMLLDGDLGEIPPTISSRLDQVYDSNKRMITLVNDLLNVSRIQQNRVKDDPKDTNLVEIIKATIEELKSIAEHNFTTLILNQKNHIPDIYIDPKRFREVIENIMSNSIKYNVPNGTVTTSIKTNTQTNEIQIEIADTGLGIPKEDHNKIFGKFYRASNVLPLDTEGSGLGLFVVKSFVEKWGGTVTFQSPTISEYNDKKELIEKGTTFYIKIPLITKS